MAFIRIQKPVRNENGDYIGGNASIVKSVYVQGAGKNHCKQKVIERLGSVIFLDKERKKGKFLSPTRGHVSYDIETNIFTPLSKKDTDIEKHGKKELALHTVFGDSWFLLQFLKKGPFYDILRSLFPADDVFQRAVAHLVHTVARSGQDIDCSDFAVKNFISYLIPEIGGISSLGTDTDYYRLMADTNLKTAFFKAFIAKMKEIDPDFGKCCFMDSSPLPNEIETLMQNYFCSHGTSENALQVRMILVLDQATGMPVWYDIIAGNVPDVSTVKNTTEFLKEELELDVTKLVLDAGYCSRALIESYGKGEQAELLVRMPAKRGYGHRALYDRCFPQFSQAKYSFVRKGHVYYGKCIKKELWGVNLNAYVYVDKTNAYNSFNRFITENEETFEAMKDKDKNYIEYSGGFFVLLRSLPGDKETPPTPREVLDEYFNRTAIENVFKTAKNYVEILPISKEDPDAVMGKIFSDMIATDIVISIRAAMSEKMKKLGLPKLMARFQSLMCTLTENGTVLIDAPNKQVKEILSAFKIQCPGFLENDECSSILK